MTVGPVFASPLLTHTELQAAALDGDLTPLGEGYAAADAPETPWLRAQSLRPTIGTTLAATHSLAAWVWGALAEVPRVLTVQRVSAKRGSVVPRPGVAYRDGRLETEDVAAFGSVHATTVSRTLADLARIRDVASVDLVAAFYPESLADAIAWCESHTGRPGARVGLAILERVRTA